MTEPTLPPGENRRHHYRMILSLAWPVLVGQLAVLGFSTIDTVLVGRASAQDLAALAVGGAAYITIFVGLMGVILAIGPIAGQLFGAKSHEAAGDALRQSWWLALLLSVPGSALLAMPEPFLSFARTPPEVEPLVRHYLLALAVALPAALLFTSYRGFNTAVSRPKAVMALQVMGLCCKVPLSAWFIFGGAGVPAMGAPGAGLATAVVMWVQLLVALWVLRRDDFYSTFGLRERLFGELDGKVLWAQLRLGVPMGLSIMVEVTGFTFMALFISRLGTTPVAGHQIVANLVALMFMVPLALSNATSTLVAQRIGARQTRAAHQTGWHGLEMAAMAALVMGVLVLWRREDIVGLYTHDAAVAAAALPLLTWLVLFHFADAVQTLAAFVLRAWRITTVPLLIYAGAIWGVGIGGGQVLAFGHWVPADGHLLGAPGFWAAATAGLSTAALALTGFWWWRVRHRTEV